MPLDFVQRNASVHGEREGVPHPQMILCRSGQLPISVERGPSCSEEIKTARKWQKTAVQRGVTAPATLITPRISLSTSLLSRTHARMPASMRAP